MLYKLTTKVSFQFNYNLLKQTNGFTICGPLSVALADIHIIRVETDIVVPIRPIFYKRYVDDIYNCCQKNAVDKVYDGLNNYHPKVRLTIETNPLRFLDKKIVHTNGMIEARLHMKKTKLPTPWTSNIPKRYERNTIKGELYWAKCISSNFRNEVTLVRNECKSTGYPMRFVNSVIHEFPTSQTNEYIEFIIPPRLFEATKIVLVEIPYCLKNENSSKQFMKKFEKFTNDMFDVRVKWLTKKIKTLVKVKCKSLHQACKI